jgi:RHS repeat-associated protein
LFISGGTAYGMDGFRAGSLDTDGPTERVVHHNAGADGIGGSSYLDSVVMIDRDLTSAWGSAADGTLETRLYFAQNWRADTSVVLGASGAILRSYKYTAYGKRIEVDAGDYNRDGFVDPFDYDDFMACYEDSICVGSRTADVDRNGFVDFFDFDLFVEAYDNDTERAHGGLRTLYAGYERDPGLETQHADSTLNDVYHVRHRVYSTDLGRWTRRDPIGYVDGASLLQYRSTLLDPMGLSACESAGGDDDCKAEQAALATAIEGLALAQLTLVLCLTAPPPLSIGCVAAATWAIKIQMEAVAAAENAVAACGKSRAPTVAPPAVAPPTIDRNPTTVPPCDFKKFVVLGIDYEPSSWKSDCGCALREKENRSRCNRKCGTKDDVNLCKQYAAQVHDDCRKICESQGGKPGTR